MNIFPVAEAALHDSGDEREIFGCGPVLHEQWEVQVVVNEEIVLLLVVRLHVGLVALAKAFKTQRRVLVWRAFQAAHFDTLLNVAFAD